MLVSAFAGPSVEYANSRAQAGCETGHCVFDGRFEMHYVAGQRGRHQGPQLVVNHDFLRASTMMVDPARQTASRRVNGTEAATRVMYTRSFHSLCRCVSTILRTRRAIGSSL